MTDPSLSTLCDQAAANIRTRLRAIRYDEEALSYELAAYFLFSALGILLHIDLENLPSPWRAPSVYPRVSYYNVVLDFLVEHYPEVLL